jgi:hypothetical protein
LSSRVAHFPRRLSTAVVRASGKSRGEIGMFRNRKSGSNGHQDMGAGDRARDTKDWATTFFGLIVRKAK